MPIATLSAETPAHRIALRMIEVAASVLEPPCSAFYLAEADPVIAQAHRDLAEAAAEVRGNWGRFAADVAIAAVRQAARIAGEGGQCMFGGPDGDAAAEDLLSGLVAATEVAANRDLADVAKQKTGGQHEYGN